MSYVKVQNGGATRVGAALPGVGSLWVKIATWLQLIAILVAAWIANLQRYQVAWRRFASESAYRARAGPGQAYPD
jgi:hypothetical protein